MKKITLLLALATGMLAGAQETPAAENSSKSIYDRKYEVKLGAVKALAGVIFEGTFEYIHSRDFTYGASILGNFDSDNDYPQDFAFTPFARFYFQESKEYGAKGFFVEGFGQYFTGHYEEYYYINYDDYYNTDYRKVNYSAGALGISLGKKWFNHTGFSLEVLAGLGRTIGGNSYAPDFVFRGDLNIGYRF